MPLDRFICLRSYFLAWIFLATSVMPWLARAQDADLDQLSREGAGLSKHARSLSVSHWAVASEATVPLTTAMLKEAASNPRLGKAQAQRKAMLALINTPGHPEYAHPLFWAPFVVAKYS